MKNISTIFIVWINLSLTYLTVESLSGWNLAPSIRGDQNIKGESSLIFDANSVSGKNSSFDNNNNNDNSNIINTNSTSYSNGSNSPTTKATEIVQIKYDLDVESSDIWQDYQDNWNDNIAVFPTVNPSNHFHYEAVSTSSKSNLCRVQCIAICDTSRVRILSLITKACCVFMNPQIVIATISGFYFVPDVAKLRRLTFVINYNITLIYLPPANEVAGR